MAQVSRSQQIVRIVEKKKKQQQQKNRIRASASVILSSNS
jgi:hypothetical protein